MPISSEHCCNHQAATIQDLMWFRGNQRGCSILPQQKVFLGQWISFPSEPNLFPVNHEKLTSFIDQASEVFVLIETDTMPALNEEEVLLVNCYVLVTKLNCFYEL